jgi:hypothetical protein
MLVLTAIVENDKIVLNGLQNVAREVPDAVRSGFNRIGPGIFAEAFQLLNGPGRPQVRLRDTDRQKATRPRGQFAQLGARPGSYPPVPSISGNLKRLLGWVGPGESKGDFTAGDLDLILFDSADYASFIFEGKGSSSKYGERQAIQDGMENYGGVDKMAQVLDEEIQKTIDKESH